MSEERSSAALRELEFELELMEATIAKDTNEINMSVEKAGEPFI